MFSCLVGDPHLPWESYCSQRGVTAQAATISTLADIFAKVPSSHHELRTSVMVSVSTAWLATALVPLDIETSMPGGGMTCSALRVGAHTSTSASSDTRSKSSSSSNGQSFKSNAKSFPEAAQVIAKARRQQRRPNCENGQAVTAFTRS